jgi:hypothetical protein
MGNQFSKLLVLLLIWAMRFDSSRFVKKLPMIGERCTMKIDIYNEDRYNEEY